MVKWKGGQLSQPWRYLCIHDNPGSGAHPNQTTELMLEEKKKGPQTVVSKTKHSKMKTEARSTQISKRKHPKLENEAPKFRKRSTQNSKTKHPELENEAPKTQKRSTQISKPL